MSVIQIYYAWVLRQFSQLNKLSVPTEIIVFITRFCKPKFRFIEEAYYAETNIIQNLIYYAWILQQFSQLNKLFLSTELIIFITNLCKPNIGGKSSHRYTVLKSHLNITQNLIPGYFKSKPEFCHREMIPDTVSIDIHNDSSLKKFFIQNNIMGMTDYIMTYHFIIILTKCNRVLISGLKYISIEASHSYSDSEDEHYVQYNLVIPEDSIEILNFPFETNKIFQRWDFIILRSVSGIFYCFPYDDCVSDYSENHTALIEIPIRNIKKMIFLSRIHIILTNDGYVWINNGDLPNDFKQVRITNVIKIFHTQYDNGIYINFLTMDHDIYSYYMNDLDNVNILEPMRINLSKVICVEMNIPHCVALTINGDIYSYSMDCLSEPIKINLSKVICVKIIDSYRIALTCNYDLYMWGNIKRGMQLIQDDIGNINVPSEYNDVTPIFIDRIIFDDLSSVI